MPQCYIRGSTIKYLCVPDEVASNDTSHLHRRTTARALPRWSRDEDLWVRRSSLLAHLLPMRRGDGDLDAFLELALPLAAEKEFFIRKAIGWVLREASKKRPDEVYRILLAHRDELSGLSLREAAKRLSPARRESLR
jgi:3-methyladenine DNA glycosylase AlkD